MIGLAWYIAILIYFIFQVVIHLLYFFRYRESVNARYFAPFVFIVHVILFILVLVFAYL